MKFKIGKKIIKKNQRHSDIKLMGKAARFIMTLSIGKVALSCFASWFRLGRINHNDIHGRQQEGQNGHFPLWELGPRINIL